MGFLAELVPFLVSVLNQAPALIEDVKKIWAIATAATPPTVDQQAAIDAALEQAHKDLQAS